jgi:hypothetical protein
VGVNHAHEALDLMPDQEIVRSLRSLLEERLPEERLLAATARLRVDRAAAECAEALLALPVDWERFVAMAEAHGVAPLVYRTFSRLPIVRHVPDQALSRLHARYLTNGVANVLWQEELERVVAGLNGAGIRPMLLKGAALLHTVYPDSALRQLRDLDVLVPSGELPRAEQRLLALGYAPTDVRWPVGTWPPDWYEKAYSRQGMGGCGTVVEIHWGLARRTAPLRIPVDALARASEPILVNGFEAAVLSPIHQILHLSTHMAYNDGFGVGLARPVDLHEAIESFRHSLDWDALAAESRRFRASRCLRYSLAIVAALFGTQVPPSVLQDPAGPRLHADLASAALERILSNDRNPSRLPSALAKLISTDRTDLAAVRELLLPRPRRIREAHHLFEPGRVLRALRYVRVVW